MTTAYKFLGHGAVGLLSAFRWPTPRGDGPGAWVEAEGRLELGANGVHACSLHELVAWIDDELWVIELGGSVREQDGLVLARRGRLLRRVETWNPETARAFAEDCVEQVREAAAAARPGTEFARDAAGFLADAAELARGGRPEGQGPIAGVRAPTPGAIAANLGFVAAHVAGRAAAELEGNPDAYGRAFDGERGRQRLWLETRLGLGGSEG